MPPTVSSILVIDPHPIYRDGIAAIIARDQADVEVHGAGGFQEAAALIRRQPIHLIITDIRFGEQNAIDFLRDLSSEKRLTRCLILSAADEIQAGRCIRAGASGFICKSAPVPQLHDAIRLVLGGHLYLSERLSHALINGHQTAPSNSPSKLLTGRELQIFTLLGQCHSVSTIAGKLGLSVKTIEAHREHIKNKLGYHNAAEVIAAAVRWHDDNSFSI